MLNKEFDAIQKAIKEFKDALHNAALEYKDKTPVRHRLDAWIRTMLNEVLDAHKDKIKTKEVLKGNQQWIVTVTFKDHLASSENADYIYKYVIPMEQVLCPGNVKPSEHDL